MEILADGTTSQLIASTTSFANERNAISFQF